MGKKFAEAWQLPIGASAWTSACGIEIETITDVDKNGLVWIKVYPDEGGPFMTFIDGKSLVLVKESQCLISNVSEKDFPLVLESEQPQQLSSS